MWSWSRKECRSLIIPVVLVVGGNIAHADTCARADVSLLRHGKLQTGHVGVAGDVVDLLGDVLR